jgi:Xaa-Pro aminopeptidase
MRQQAYTPIVGSGYNSAVLHYSTNKDVMLATDIVLIGIFDWNFIQPVDAGAEFNGYATDITRTFPVNGQWSPQQEVVYSMVLKTQMALINMVSYS